MGDRRFRFGLIAAPTESGAQWRATARRAEELGYDTLPMPDGMHLFAPMLAAATAAAVTSTLRVGTFVLASTARPPRTAAWEAHSLTALTDQRFEMGIGTGNPWMNRQVVEEIGFPETSPGERLARVRETVEQLRKLDTETRTPVLIAAGGPRSRALAGKVADIVTLPHPGLATAADVRKLVEETREAAGGRADDIEFMLNVVVFGDTMPPAMERIAGMSAADLVEGGSQLVLRGTPREVADDLLRRRDEIGYSYVVVNAYHVEEFAPVIELLKDR